MASSEDNDPIENETANNEATKPKPDLTKTVKSSNKKQAPKATCKKSAGAKSAAKQVKSKPPTATRTKSKSTGGSKPNQKSVQDKSVRKLKGAEPKSKGTKAAAKSKPAIRAETQEKSCRSTKEAKQTSATPADVIKQILSDLKTKSKLDHSPSSLSSADSDNSQMDSSPSLPETKSKPKMKTTHKKNKAKSCKAASSSKGKKPAPKAKEPSKGANGELSPESATQDNASDAVKTIKQLKMDPEVAQALEKYLPDLVTAIQKQAGPAEGKTAPAADQFTNDEMEDLNDELTDLNTSISTLRHSYGSIVRSLANMQKRRQKKTALAPITAAPGADPANPEAAAAQPVALTIDDICARVATNYDTKYSMDRFLDGNSRDALFQELFKEVNEINAAMALFKSFFNGEGYFQKETYLAQEEFKLNRGKFNDCLKVIKDLSKSVTAILKAYNTDLLDMFRITSQAS